MVTSSFATTSVVVKHTISVRWSSFSNYVCSWLHPTFSEAHMNILFISSKQRFSVWLNGHIPPPQWCWLSCLLGGAPSITRMSIRECTKAVLIWNFPYYIYMCCTNYNSYSYVHVWKASRKYILHSYLYGRVTKVYGIRIFCWLKLGWIMFSFPKCPHQYLGRMLFLIMRIDASHISFPMQLRFLVKKSIQITLMGFSRKL